MNKNVALLLSIGFIAAVVGIWSSSVLLNADRAVISEDYQVATVLPIRRPMPPLELVDQNNAPFDIASFSDDWTLLFMGFTNCGHICPMTMARLRAIVDALEQPVEVLFVSVDPGRDTPDVIANYVGGFDETFVGVTGQPAELDKLASALGAPYFVEVTSDQYVVDHSGAIFILDPSGAFAGVITPPHEITPILSDLNKLIGG